MVTSTSPKTWTDAVLTEPVQAPPPMAGEAAPRLTALFREHVDFIARSLRRLGVPEHDVEDAVQEVFIVANGKLAHIVVGQERAFLFGTAMRIASNAVRVNRRARGRRPDGDASEAVEGHPSDAPPTDEMVEQHRARHLLDDVIRFDEPRGAGGIHALRARRDDERGDRDAAWSPPGHGGLTPAPGARAVRSRGGTAPRRAPATGRSPMTDPVRLLQSDADPLRQALLRSAGRDGLSSSAKARVATALGVGAAAALLPVAATVPPVAAATSKAVTVKLAAILVKWVSVVTLASVAAGGVVAATVAVRAARHEAATAKEHARAARPWAAVASPPKEDDLEVTEVDTDPPSIEFPSNDPVRSSTRSHVPGTDTALVAEITALDAARTALRAGNAAEALRDLDDYRRDFRHGRLVQEALVLRVEALVASGDKQSAEAIARRFLAKWPASPYAARVASLVHSTGTPENH